MQKKKKEKLKKNFFHVMQMTPEIVELSLSDIDFGLVNSFFLLKTGMQKEIVDFLFHFV